MSTTPHPSILEIRREQALPHLSARQLADLEKFGTRHRYRAGEELFREGSRHVGMFAVLSGRIDIFHHTDDGEELITSHDAGQLAGEIGLLAGQAALVSARAAEDSEVLVIPEDKLQQLMVTHAELSELILRAFILRRMALIEGQIGGVTLIGSRRSSDTHRLVQFLIRNTQPYTYRDLDRDPGTATLLERLHVGQDDLPVAVTLDGRVMRRPSPRELADAMGLGPEPLDGRLFDLAVIGAGPAGLAAAVYGASEGLDVVVLDSKAPGGQAGTTSKIENYFGFPTGISGQALAGRGFVQAQKFGAEIAIPREVVSFDCGGGPYKSIALDGGEKVLARSVVIASGARYHKPDLERLESFEGRGVYYAASFLEAQLCMGEEVIVVGGGNSAGQAAVFLSAYASHVHVLVRAKSLAASMSDYLIQRIHAIANATLRTRTELVQLMGDGALEGVRWRGADGSIEDRPIQHVFLFCGAEPNTSWVAHCLTIDANRFIKTGGDLTAEDLAASRWPLERSPMRLETSHPGVFAVGDVRAGSVKRVAAAVGEGSTAVQLVHQFLARS